MNFWKPGGNTNFKALNPGDLFLFKLHYPDNFIVGGGFFVRFSMLPSFLAWDAFAEQNGALSLDDLNKRILKYRRLDASQDTLNIGCIIITEPFFLAREEWIPAPEDWRSNIVQGRSYSDADEIGRNLFKRVEMTLEMRSAHVHDLPRSSNEYSLLLTKHRLGQGGFRISVMDAYKRRCAVTGEKTLPVLEAAHILPFSKGGPQSISNGVLLRSDIHQLYDTGYVTITPEYKFEVSQRLHSDFGNGKIYYSLHGKTLLSIPDKFTERPTKEYLSWHNDNVYFDK